MHIFLLQLIVLVLAFLSHGHEAIAAAYVPPYTSKVAQITKLPFIQNTSLYSIDVLMRYETRTHRNFLIDLDAPVIWHDCILQWNMYPGSCPTDTICSSPVSCEEYQCTDVRASYSYQSPSCPPVTNSSTLPGWGYCTCPVDQVNPLTRSCGQPMLNYDTLFLNTSDGRNTLPEFLEEDFNGACAPSSLLQFFPENVRGVMALSSSPYALPSILYPNINVLALCLPSSFSAPGVLFVGSGPYYFLQQANVDVSSFLSYTPLLKVPDSFGYYIGVKAILIDGKPIHRLPQDTATKLSTIFPYTTLRTDVYNILIDGFSNATKQVPRVDPIQPFGLCFNTSTVGHTRVGLRVPHVAFYLQNGVKWTLFGANSMKQISKDVACLAFVDGGMDNPEAIVIGTLQMEDNLLVFNLENSTFGFSSSLLFRKTTCSNFNYTLA